MNTRTTVRSIAAIAALATCLAAPAAQAQFLGTQATGSLQINGGTTNLFDPVNGFVPNGVSNKTQGTTVAVAEPAIEFGFYYPIIPSVANITVNITGNTIVLTDALNSEASVAPSLVTLTDSAFAGRTFVKTSDPTSSFTFSLTGSTLSLNFAGVQSPGTYATVLTVTPAAVPEPGNIALFVGLGVTGAGFAVRRRQARK